MSYSFRGVALPSRLKESIDAYVSDGRPLGGFLRALVENDWKTAMRLADGDSIAAMPALFGYFHNEVPTKCWGSKGSHDSWARYKAAEREMKLEAK